MKGFIAVWLLCSIYTWGTLQADLHYRSVHDWGILHDEARDGAGICALFAVSGPFGALAGASISNFNQHGWEIWWHEDYGVKKI